MFVGYDGLAPSVIDSGTVSRSMCPFVEWFATQMDTLTITGCEWWS